MYKVEFRARAVRTLKKMDTVTSKTILVELERLAADPLKHPNVRKLSGVNVVAYRLRIGRWRVLYFILSAKRTIEIIEIFMKKSRSDYDSL